MHSKLRLRARIDHLLSQWFNFSTQHAIAVIILSILASAGALYFTINNLRINTYSGNVFSDELPWRQDVLTYEKAFPQFEDSIVVVLDAPTADQARNAASRLYHRLKEDTTHFKWIFYPPESRFFRENGLLFEDIDDLEKLSNQLAKVQPFLAEVSIDPSIRGIFNLLGRALKEREKAELDLSSVFDRIAKTLRAYLNGSTTPLSWIEIMSGEDAKAEDKRVLMEIMPKIEYSSLAPGEEIMTAIRKTGEELHLANNGVTMRLTGEAALSVDELKSASIGAQMASLGSFICVSLVC